MGKDKTAKEVKAAKDVLMTMTTDTTEMTDTTTTGVTMITEIPQRPLDNLDIIAKKPRNKKAAVVVKEPVASPVVDAILTVEEGRTDRSILRPKVDPYFYMSPDTAEVLDAVEALSKKLPQNVLLSGPQGCGKTELSMLFAAKRDRPLLIMNCSTVREAKDWFGFRDAQAGSLFWHKSDFVRACQMGNCVILLDEFNRLPPTLHNSLYPLLDARRSTFVEEVGEIIQVAPGTVFMATCNLGFTHTGTHTMDSAIEDRFGFRVDLDFPSDEVETTIIRNKVPELPAGLATKLARFAKDIRKKATGNGATLTRAVSTRQMLSAATLMAEFRRNGSDIKKALDYTVVPYYTKEGGRESEQAQVLQLIQGIFSEKAAG